MAEGDGWDPLGRGSELSLESKQYSSDACSDEHIKKCNILINEDCWINNYVMVKTVLDFESKAWIQMLKFWLQRT